MEKSDAEIRPIPRDPLRFDLMQLFAAHLDARGGTLQDVDAQGEFVARLGQSLPQVAADSALARGLRAEALFAALAVSLGRIDLIKQEDAGTAWATRRKLRIPDYRVVLPDGAMFLVEVKHFHQAGSSTKQFPVSRNYLSALHAYGELVGCPVKLAVYWERWNLWTLVPLSACELGGRTSLSMDRALKANELGMLGDLYISTRFPLRFRLIADPAHESSHADNAEIRFTIGGVELYCGDHRVTDDREWNIAMWLMLFGQWEEEVRAEISHGRLAGVDFIRMPPEDHGQGFELVGTLSSMFSRMYLSSTSDADRITRLGIKVVGGSLGSLIPDDYKSETLPLLRVRQVADPSTRSPHNQGM